MTPIFVLIFITGLIVGSFLNVVILRTVSNESIVFPGSKCPKCQTPIKWYHNIPVLSYIFLKGKCAYCKESISIQYPLVELLTGFIFLVMGILYLSNIFSEELSSTFLLIMFFTAIITSSLLIVISGTDIKEMQVSDAHTYSLMGIGLLYSLIVGSFNFFPDLQFGIANWGGLFIPVLFTIFGIISGFIFMEIIRRGLNYLLKVETFGDGDSYIFAGIAGLLTAVFGVTNLWHIILGLFIILLSSASVSVIFTLPKYIKHLVINKNWKVLAALFAFIAYASLYFIGTNNGWFLNNAILIISIILLLIIGEILCFMIISGIKDNQDNSTQIPFGPALCISGLIGLITLPFVLGII